MALDAQADVSGGFLAIDAEAPDRKWAGFTAFPEDVIAAMGFAPEALADGANPTSPAEAGMPVVALFHHGADYHQPARLRAGQLGNEPSPWSP